MLWHQTVSLQAHKFICGFCGDKVASKEGYTTTDAPNGRQAHIFICPGCTKPSLFHFSLQMPGVAPGNEVAHLPKDIEALYLEARRSAGAGANTAAVLACRKLLMNIAVAQGAKAGRILCLLRRVPRKRWLCAAERQSLGRSHSL